jgi:hypothetical protein
MKYIEKKFSKFSGQFLSLPVYKRIKIARLFSCVSVFFI